MFHLLGFLFFIIIAVLLIGLSIIGTILRSLFGANRHYTSNTTRQQSFGTSDRTDSTPTEEGEIRPRRKKFFSKNEGEYVDFEEIKE